MSITYNHNGEIWTWESRVDAWLWGEPHNGMGVVKEYEVWFGNIVRGSSSDVLGYGPYKTAEEGMEDLFKRWNDGT